VSGAHPKQHTWADGHARAGQRQCDRGPYLQPNLFDNRTDGTTLVAVQRTPFSCRRYRAASQELSYADFLHGLLEEESVARAIAATQCVT